MDKSEVGRLVEAADLDALLADVGDADELALFTDMLIEFRLDAAVARLAAHAAQHDDAEMQDLARFLARVPGDERHWGRSRAERVALLRPPDDHR